VKYGSDGDFNSNVAPHFIGVFDTVASLGAKGLRRLAIQVGLGAAFVVTVGSIAALPMLLLSWLLDRWSPFWPTWWGLLVLTVLGIGSWWAHRQKRSRLKVIRDFPNPGDPPREHYA
jgi:protein-S-isoprenylcysteine O-methyltransferase Ste14